MTLLKRPSDTTNQAVASPTLSPLSSPTLTATPSLTPAAKPAAPIATPTPTTTLQAVTSTNEKAAPKCFGTDYYGKWNTTGMTFESMKIDRPDYQQKCAQCSFFERCYMINHIRIMRIKR